MCAMDVFLVGAAAVDSLALKPTLPLCYVRVRAAGIL